MPQRHGIAFVLAFVGATLAFSADASSMVEPAHDDQAWKLCTEAAGQIETEFGIPDHLLTAVTLTETGRRGPDRQISSWPWTVHDGTRGYHLNSKQEAVALVQMLRESGRRSVDVGCMQVNLRHHPRAFTNIEDGFDPELNLRYAATFLSRLKQRHGTWEEAVARYHSYNPEFYEHYARKVLSYWQREKAIAAKAKPSPTTAAALSVAAMSANDIVRPRPAPRNAADQPIILAAAGGDRPATSRERPAVQKTTEGMPGRPLPEFSSANTQSEDLSDFFARSFGWPQ